MNPTSRWALASAELAVWPQMAWGAPTTGPATLAPKADTTALRHGVEVADPSDATVTLTDVDADADADAAGTVHARYPGARGSRPDPLLGDWKAHCETWNAPC